MTIIPRDVLEKLKPLVARALNHRVVGYSPNKHGRIKPVVAQFIFTMLDRKLSGKQKKVYRRVDSVRASWGALFIAADLAVANSVSNRTTGKYKDGIKNRTDVSIIYTRHDMRRGFNLEAKQAGMSLEDRALILGHSKEVNENHYRGKQEFDAEKIAELVNFKMGENLRKLKLVK